MKKMKNFIILNCILIFSVMFLTACTHKNNTENIKVRLNEVTRSIFYTPQYVALSKNFFKDENLEIELSTSDGSDKVMTSLLASQADIGLIGTSSIISVIEQGCENHPIAFAELTRRDGSFLVGRKNDFRWENLKNKEIIAGRKGGVPEMVLEYVLKKHGLTPNQDVKLLNNIQFNLMSVAFSRGIGDYVALFEPVASRIISEKNLFTLIDIAQECDPIPYTCYCASKKYIQGNPKIIEKFTIAIYKAQKWVQNHSSKEIAEEISKFFIDFDFDSLCKCIDKYKAIGVWSENPLITAAQFNTLQEIMISAGELKNAANFMETVNNTWAEKAMEKV